MLRNMRDATPGQSTGQSTGQSAGQSPPSAAAGDERLLATLLRTVHELAAITTLHTRDALRELNLSETAASLLWMLDPAEQPVTMRDLARRIGCDPSNITLVANRLEHAGLTLRIVNPHDARSRLLALTPAGTELRRRLTERLRRDTPLAALTRKEQRQLAHLLGKLPLPHRTQPATGVAVDDPQP